MMFSFDLNINNKLLAQSSNDFMHKLKTFKLKKKMLTLLKCIFVYIWLEDCPHCDFNIFDGFADF